MIFRDNEWLDCFDGAYALLTLAQPNTLTLQVAVELQIPQHRVESNLARLYDGGRAFDFNWYGDELIEFDHLLELFDYPEEDPLLRNNNRLWYLPEYHFLVHLLIQHEPTHLIARRMRRTRNAIYRRAFEVFNHLGWNLQIVPSEDWLDEMERIAEVYPD